jgi:hypothetical protein
MIEVLNNYLIPVQLFSAIVTTSAMVTLVYVTWKYTNATKKMADTMYKQFVYEHKPYLSVEYDRKEPIHTPNQAPVLELKNYSEKSRINVHYNLFVIYPVNISSYQELQKPETLEISKLVNTQDVVIEPKKSYGLIPIALIQSGLEDMGVDFEKDYHYGIIIKGHYTPDIPDVASFPILKYWQVAESPEQNYSLIIPENLEFHN